MEEISKNKEKIIKTARIVILLAVFVILLLPALFLMKNFINGPQPLNPTDFNLPVSAKEIVEKRHGSVATFELSPGHFAAVSGVLSQSNPKEIGLASLQNSLKNIWGKIFSFILPLVFADSTAPTSPGTVIDDATVGTKLWSNPDYAKVSDDTYAYTSAGIGTFYSHYLKATNFGFSIPNGATINGILVEFERLGSAVSQGVAKDNGLYIVKADGSIGATNKADTGNSWSTDETYFSYGSSSDLWGENWTSSDINDVDFGVALSVQLYKAGGYCLEKNTLVRTKDGEKKVSDIKLGERVFSLNEQSNQVEEDEVIGVWHRNISNYDNKYFYIYLDSGQEVKATYNHPFYVEGEWKLAEQLKIGNILKNEKMEDVKIKNIKVVKNYTDDVWDLTVKNNHNFFANGILVHNSSASVDHIRIIVYYTSATPSVPGTIGNGIKIGNGIIIR